MLSLLPNLDNHINTVLASYFEEKLSNITKSKYKFNISQGYCRCLARVWDINNPKGPNINKRCRFPSMDGFNVCKTHLLHNKHGFVNEYPPDHVIRCYSSKNSKILDSLNINHSLYIIENNINKYLKKNVTYKSDKMSLELIDYPQELAKYPDIDSLVAKALVSKHLTEDNENISAIYKQIVKDNKIKHITIADKKEIEANICKYLKQLGNSSGKKKKKLVIRKPSVKTDLQSEPKIEVNSNNNTPPQKIKSAFNTENLECVKIIDHYCMSCEVFLDVSNNNLYTSNGNIVGKCNEWIDDDEDIPTSYKNADNKVLHPKTRLPVLEYTITQQGSVFTNIAYETYREYEYDDDLEVFRKTNSVVRED